MPTMKNPEHRVADYLEKPQDYNEDLLGWVAKTDDASGSWCHRCAGSGGRWENIGRFEDLIDVINFIAENAKLTEVEP